MGTPVADTFAVTLPVDSRPSLWSAVTTERRTLVLSRVSGEDDGSAITLVLPDQADGYWVATDLLDADGSTATDVTVTREAGATRFTIATQPEDSRTFLVVLEYDSTTWDVDVPGTGTRRLRPASTLVAGLTDHAAAEGGTATLNILEVLLGSGGPTVDPD